MTQRIERPGSRKDRASEGFTSVSLAVITRRLLRKIQNRTGLSADDLIFQWAKEAERVEEDRLLHRQRSRSIDNDPDGSSA